MGNPAPKAPKPVDLELVDLELVQEAARQQRALNMRKQHGPGGTVAYKPTGRVIDGVEYTVHKQFSNKRNGKIRTESA